MNIGGSKEFELLVKQFDPMYDDLIAATEIVKQFIMDHDLIIYGGTALDFALRLHGDKIYPDNMLPDLDFYSYENVAHAYELADILFEKYPEARAINASHMETMKVDIGDNHFIADISYRPRTIFDIIPTITYNGLRVVHPLVQRLDTHSSLSFPFDNVPREVIFERWAKDVTRFNLMSQYYPLPAPGQVIPTHQIAIDIPIQYILHGFAAYSLYYAHYADTLHDLHTNNEDPAIIPATFDVQGSRDDNIVTFGTLDSKLEIVSYSLGKILRDIGAPSSTKKYAKYANMIPARLECGMKYNTTQYNLTIYSTKNKLLSVSTITYAGKKFRIVSVQFLLKHFLGMYFLSTGKLANTYMMYYTSLMNMVLKGATLPAFGLSLKTYGRDNISLSMEVSLNRLYSDLHISTPYAIPINYYPGRSRVNNRPKPTFDPLTLKFFIESGEEQYINIDKYRDVGPGRDNK
jgi:hypothetical protein